MTQQGHATRTSNKELKSYIANSSVWRDARFSRARHRATPSLVARSFPFLSNLCFLRTQRAGVFEPLVCMMQM